MSSTPGRKICRIHLSFVAVGFLAPLVPVLTVIIQAIAAYGLHGHSSGILSSGLGYQLSTPSTCAPSNIRVLFYSFAMYVAIIQGVGTTFMILLFYHLCKVNVKFILLHIRR